MTGGRLRHEVVPAVAGVSKEEERERGLEFRRAEEVRAAAGGPFHGPLGPLGACADLHRPHGKKGSSCRAETRICRHMFTTDVPTVQIRAWTNPSGTQDQQMSCSESIPRVPWR